MSTTDYLKLKLNSESEDQTSFLDWRMSMNGDNADSNMNVIDRECSRLNNDKASKTDLNTHINNKNNPHGVTAAQIGAATNERGLKSGGSAGQVLTKKSNTDYDAEWVDLELPDDTVLFGDNIPNIYIPGGSGDIVSFEASNAAGHPLDVSVEVVAEQEGEGDPSPTNIRPITIPSAADVGTIGKNLIPPLNVGTSASIQYSRAADGALIINPGTASGLSSRDTPLSTPLPPGTYTISLNNTEIKSGVGVNLRNASGGFVSGGELLATSINATLTVTTTVTVRAIRFFVTAATIISEPIILRIQLEEGAVSTPYKPYNGTTHTLTSPEPLSGLPGYPATITNDGKAIIRAGYVIFNNQSNVRTISEIDDTRVMATIQLMSESMPTTSYLPSMCSHFQDNAVAGNPSAVWSARVANITGWGGLRYQCVIAKSALTSYDAAGVRAWFQQMANAGTPIQLVFAQPEGYHRTVEIPEVSIPAPGDKITVFSNAGPVTVGAFEQSVAEAISGLEGDVEYLANTSIANINGKSASEDRRVDIHSSDIPHISIPGGTGNIVSFEAENAAGRPLDVSVEVVAEQEGEGTPTPDNKRPFKAAISAVEVSVAKGKNKQSKPITVGFINSAGRNAGATDSVRTLDFIPISPDTTYALSNDKGYSNRAFFYSDANQDTFISANFTGSFRSPANAHFMRLGSNSGQTPAQNDPTVIYQLELGLMATDIEPYNGNTYTLTSTEPLCGLPGLPATINNNGEVVVPAKHVVLDGINIVAISITELANTVSFTLNAGFSIPSGTLDILCDTFPVSASTADYEHARKSNSSNGAIYFYLRKNRLSEVSVDGVNEWVRNNPIAIVGRRTTPILESTTPITIPAPGDNITVFSSAGPVTVGAFEQSVAEALNSGQAGVELPVSIADGGTGNKFGLAQGITGVLSVDQGGTGNTTGLAAQATALANSRTIRTNLASTSTASFNGTANITPGVTGILSTENGGNGTTTGISAAVQTALDERLTISGTAVAATKLATARTMRTNLASTSTASFDGSANVTPGVTGVLGVANGGTGNTTGISTATQVALDAKATVTNYSVVFTVAGWSQKADGTYTQTVTTNGVTVDMEPICDVILSETLEVARAELESYSLISRMTTNEGSVTAICFDGRPESAFTVRLKVVQ